MNFLRSLMQGTKSSSVPSSPAAPASSASVSPVPSVLIDSGLGDHITGSPPLSRTPEKRELHHSSGSNVQQNVAQRKGHKDSEYESAEELFEDTDKTDPPVNLPSQDNSGATNSQLVESLLETATSKDVPSPSAPQQKLSLESTASKESELQSVSINSVESITTTSDKLIETKLVTVVLTQAESASVVLTQSDSTSAVSTQAESTSAAPIQTKLASVVQTQAKSASVLPTQVESVVPAQNQVDSATAASIETESGTLASEAGSVTADTVATESGAAATGEPESGTAATVVPESGIAVTGEPELVTVLTAQTESGTATTVEIESGTATTVETESGTATTVETESGTATTVEIESDTATTVEPESATVETESATLETESGTATTVETELATVETESATVETESGTATTVETELATVETESDTTAGTVEPESGTVATVATESGATVETESGTTAGTVEPESGTVATVATESGATVETESATVETESCTATTVETKSGTVATVEPESATLIKVETESVTANLIEAESSPAKVLDTEAATTGKVRLESASTSLVGAEPAAVDQVETKLVACSPVLVLPTSISTQEVVDCKNLKTFNFDSIDDDTDFEKFEEELIRQEQAQEREKGSHSSFNGSDNQDLVLTEELARSQEIALSQELALSESKYSNQNNFSSPCVLNESIDNNECRVSETSSTLAENNNTGVPREEPIVQLKTVEVDKKLDTGKLHYSPETTGTVVSEFSKDTQPPSVLDKDNNSSPNECNNKSITDTSNNSDVQLPVNEFQTSEDTSVNSASVCSNSKQLASLDTKETSAAEEEKSLFSTNFPAEDIPIVPKKAYNLDFLDCLDDPNFNPFANRTAINNTPPPSPPPGAKLPPLKAAVKKKKAQPKNTSQSSTSNSHPELSSVDTSKAIEDNQKSFDNSIVDVNTSAVKGTVNNGTALEITFDDNLNKSSDTDKKLPKKPVLKSRAPIKKKPVISNKARKSPSKEISPAQQTNNSSVDKTSGDSTVNNPEDEIIVPSKGYNLDFLDNLDDSNFNPFTSQKGLRSSPTKELATPSFPQNSTTELPEKQPTEKDNFDEIEASVCQSENIINDKGSSIDTSKTVGNSAIGEEDIKGEDTDATKLISAEDSLDSEVQRPTAEKQLDYHQHKVNVSLKRNPSFGGISVSLLESAEFDQLLGKEASRVAEELTSQTLTESITISTESLGICRDAASEDCFSDCADHFTGDMPLGSKSARRSLNLEGSHSSDDPFKRCAKINRSPPPIGPRRPVSVGGAAEPYIPKRNLHRDEHDDGTNSSLDSGLASSFCGPESLDCANHSEAGPEIATGMTTSDLQAASQFFKDATELERQIKRSFGHCFNSSGKSDASNNSSKDGACAPPREERSAPEGTSSPTPRPQETPASDTQSTSAPTGYLTQAQVDALLKRQEAQFEERLQRMCHSTDKKEAHLQQKMREEQKELAELKAAVVEVTQSREALLKMLEQYKDMLSTVVKGKSSMDKEQEKKMKEIEEQKNQALEDLANVEAAFSDVHRKYERTKQVVETMKRNEETLKCAVEEYETKIKKQEASLVTFQQHAEEKMMQASEEYENLKRSTDQELTKMGALLKKAEMKIISLQEQLDRKSRDNQELTQLLDDLIAKMGPAK